MVTSTAPIKQGLVRFLKANFSKTQVPGGIHRAFAPEKTQYPMMTYKMVYAPYDYLWGSAIILSGFDISVWAYNSVQAESLDALVLQVLKDPGLTVDGQTTLICRRTADLDDEDVDDEGRKIYMVGGTYEIQTDQPL